MDLLVIEANIVLLCLSVIERWVKEMCQCFVDLRLRTYYVVL